MGDGPPITAAELAARAWLAVEVDFTGGVFDFVDVTSYPGLHIVTGGRPTIL